MKAMSSPEVGSGQRDVMVPPEENNPGLLTPVVCLFLLFHCTGQVVPTKCLFRAMFLRGFLCRFDPQLRLVSNLPPSLISVITNSIIIHPSTQARSLAIPVFFLYSCTLFPFTKKKKKSQKNTHTQTKTKNKTNQNTDKKKLKQQQRHISIYQICLDCTHFFHCLCYFPNSENKHLSPGFLGGKITFFSSYFLLQ